jgi:hypothetical protein
MILNILGILFALLFLVSMLPFGVDIEGVNDHPRMRLILAGIRVGFPKRKPGRAAPKPEPEAEPEAESQAGWQQGVRKLRSLTQGGDSVWKEFGLTDLRSAGRALRVLIRSLRVRIHRLVVGVATPDPAMTGIAYGAACAVLATFPAKSRVRVYADFTRTSPEIDYRIELSVRPLVSLLNLIRALSYLPLRKIVRLFRKPKKHARAEEVAEHV